MDDKASRNAGVIRVASDVLSGSIRCEGPISQRIEAAEPTTPGQAQSADLRSPAGAIGALGGYGSLRHPGSPRTEEVRSDTTQLGQVRRFGAVT